QRHPDAFAQAPLVAGPAQTEQRHRPGGGREQPLQDLDGGGLAGTVRAEQAVTLATPDGEIQPIHRHHRPRRLAATPPAARGLVDLAQPPALDGPLVGAVHWLCIACPGGLRDGAVSRYTVGMGLLIRGATPADVPELLRLIGELAEYERLHHQVVAGAAQLET